MKRWLAFMLIALSPEPAMAQQRLFTPQALRTAVRDMPIQFRDPRTAWDNVRRIPRSSKIVVYTRNGRNGGQKCRFVSADGVGLTVIDLEASAQPTLHLDRADVTMISRFEGHNGSIPGAIAGAAAGFGLGFYSLVALAYKPCGAGCGDEQITAGLALVGFPILGGVLGYAAGGGNRTLKTLYIAP